MRWYPRPLKKDSTVSSTSWSLDLLICADLCGRSPSMFIITYLFGSRIDLVDIPRMLLFWLFESSKFMFESIYFSMSLFGLTNWDWVFALKLVKYCCTLSFFEFDCLAVPCDFWWFCLSASIDPSEAKKPWEVWNGALLGQKLPWDCVCEAFEYENLPYMILLCFSIWIFLAWAYLFIAKLFWKLYVFF